VILDNVDDEAAARAVRELLPHLSAGRVLITSRWSAWPPSIERADLETLAPPEAAQFLLDQTAARRTAGRTIRPKRGSWPTLWAACR
jgi:hypothetical protein